jgi:N-acetyltransferase
MASGRTAATSVTRLPRLSLLDAAARGSGLRRGIGSSNNHCEDCCNFAAEWFDARVASESDQALLGAFVKATWIKHPLTLRGQLVELRPLELESLDALFAVAQDPEIWRHTSVDYSVPEVFYPNFESAVKARESGSAYPLIIGLAGSPEIIGTTRLLEIHPQDRKMEIGVTWIARRYWGTKINSECKYLLLEHCFESLAANRVQFRAKSGNTRSRRALEKIGASFEGVMRKDKVEPDGRARDTAFYSITNDEWPALKPRLEAACSNTTRGPRRFEQARSRVPSTM